MASRGVIKSSKSIHPIKAGYRIGIVVTQWHSDITDKLLKGAIITLKKYGFKSSAIVVKEVPGSFELPLGAQWLLESEKADAIICLGCIIKGETPHFEYISQAVAYGIMELNLKHNIPFIFGVLTTTTLKQARQRSGGKHGHKGIESAMAALEMLKNKK